MKLVHIGYNLEINIQENQINVITVENQKAYTEILCDLWNQTNGLEGEFILSDRDKIKDISKEMECIFNPFELNVNDKKTITSLHKELNENSNEMFYDKASILNTHIINFIDELIQTVPYPIKYNPDLDVLNMLKLLHVEMDIQADTLLESIIDYIRVMRQICKITKFVFIGLKNYLTEKELELLYEFVFYQKVSLIIIQPIQCSILNNEKNLIIDKDLCIITL